MLWLKQPACSTAVVWNQVHVHHSCVVGSVLQQDQSCLALIDTGRVEEEGKGHL